MKELRYEYLRTHNGQIYVRKKENSEKIHVNAENDLDKLKWVFVAINCGV